MPTPLVPDRVLAVHTARAACALPLDRVIEVMRPLPVEPLAGAPVGVKGIAIIRGRATAVVDLGELLGHGATTAATARFVTVRVGGQVAALLVSGVAAVRSLAENSLDPLPPLWHGAQPAAVAALGLLDQELLLLLETAVMLPAGWAVPAGAEETP